MRPFRNPNSHEEVEANFRYLADLAMVPRPERSLRDPDWGFNAAWRFDETRFYDDTPYREIVWPENERRPEPPRRREDLDPNTEMLRLPALNLDKIEHGPEIVRDIKLPPFKVNYDSHEQLHQKLSQTVILIKNKPFVILQTAANKGQFFLYVRGEGVEGVIPYDEIKDCRGIAPSYWMWRGGACWVYRTPDRQNSQGMCQRNTSYKHAGTDAGPRPANTNFLLEALRMAKDMQYAGNLYDVLSGSGSSSLRLSSRVALYFSRKKGAPLAVEYCGRPLGLVIDNDVKIFDPLDLGPSWIKKDLASVGLGMRG